MQQKKRTTMETITFKPYTFLTLSESEEGNVYRIVKYNLIKKDWEILSGIYTDKAEVLIKIADLNQEAGLVTVAIEG